MSNTPSTMSVSLCFWIVVCLSHRLALAEYSVYREIDPSIHAGAEVCMICMVVFTVPYLFTGPHPAQPVLSVYLGRGVWWGGWPHQDLWWLLSNRCLLSSSGLHQWVQPYERTKPSASAQWMPTPQYTSHHSVAQGSIITTLGAMLSPVGATG